jgi:hypothetical protein
MARGIAESGLFRQERVKLNGRTSDPSNPEPGESWLRFDLDGETDKYGEFRVYDGSSVQSVAIVAPGTTQTEAEEVLRVQTPSGVGVIPVSPRADASIPQWSFQHNGNSLGLGQPSAIPDSVIDNFEGADSGVYESGDDLSTFYSGATSSWSRGTTNAIEGSQALEKTSADLSQIYSTPGDGLNAYPNEGDTVAWLVYYSGNVAPGPLVAASSGVDGYMYSIGGSLRIYRLDGGSYTSVGSTSVNLSTGWYWGEGRVPSSGDSSLVYDLYEVDESTLSRGNSVDSVSASDSTHLGRGIGWASASSGGTATAADWLRVL